MSIIVVVIVIVIIMFVMIIIIIIMIILGIYRALSDALAEARAQGPGGPIHACIGPEWRSERDRWGVSTHGVTANFMFFDRGTFWVLPLTGFFQQ